MNLLYIDCNMRKGAISRTRKIAEAFLAAFQENHMDVKIQTVNLNEEEINYFNEDDISLRNMETKKRNFDHPIFRYARDFANADIILISAPYWDLSFPALLKIYMEYVFASDVTFHYEETGAVGNCKAKHMLYVSTAGGYFGDWNCGRDYLQSCSEMLGIGDFTMVFAEGLDIAGADVDKLVGEAICEVKELAKKW